MLTQHDALLTSMRLHHANMESRCHAVIAALSSGDTLAASLQWTALTEGLADEIAFEESHFIPLIEALDPFEARCLRADHSVFAVLLEELGTAVDRQQISPHTAQNFFTRLADHCDREEILLGRAARTPAPLPRAA